MSARTHTFEECLSEGNVAFFGCAERVIPDAALHKSRGRARAFLRSARGEVTIGSIVRVSRYERLAQIRDEHADVYFLDREAVRVLFADFPATAQYVLVRLVPRMSWLLGVPGLLRRVYIGLVRVRGIVSLPSGSSSCRWLVLEHKMIESHNPRLCLSEEVGVQGFLDFLRREHIRYVVLRFYEKLPRLSRVGGDLDILVSDEDDRKLRTFLQEHPGPIGVDVWTVSRASHGSITYYPPPLARKIIESAVDGPAGSRIPAPREAFLGLAYHALYHKGVFAGVPSTLAGVEVNRHPENDYAGTLERLAAQAGVDIDIAMEPLDDYLAQEGWRPKLDTLAKIAERNSWVWRRFFSDAGEREMGLGIFIIKQKAVESGAAEQIEERIRAHDGFVVLRKRVFARDEVGRIADQLRGGVWNERGGKLEDFLPAIAFAVVDTRVAREAQRGVPVMDPEKGIKSLKGKLRGEFRAEGGNLVHSTETTHEAQEYLEVCFPAEADAIRAEAYAASAQKRFLSERLRTLLIRTPRILAYRFARLKQRLGAAFLDVLMR